MPKATELFSIMDALEVADYLDKRHAELDRDDRYTAPLIRRVSDIFYALANDVDTYTITTPFRGD